MQLPYRNWGFWLYFPPWVAEMQNCILTMGIYSTHLYVAVVQSSLQTSRSSSSILIRGCQALVLNLLVVKANPFGLIRWQNTYTPRMLIISSTSKNIYGGFHIKIEWIHASNFTYSKKPITTSVEFWFCFLLDFHPLKRIICTAKGWSFGEGKFID